jgi:glutathione S-transferase
MFTLYGSPISNYHNKVKLALLEKGVAYDEIYKGRKLAEDETVVANSPLAKIPFAVTDGGGLCESSVILEYLEEAYPGKPLLPKDPYARAKVREIATFIDWHVEICGRQLYSAAFFGGKPLSEANMERIKGELTTRIGALRKLAKFAPFAAGDSFTIADCSAFTSLPLTAQACKAVYGEDLVEAGGIDHRSYYRFMVERPACAKVAQDRKDALARLSS